MLKFPTNVETPTANISPSGLSVIPEPTLTSPFTSSVDVGIALAIPTLPPKGYSPSKPSLPPL